LIEAGMFSGRRRCAAKIRVSSTVEVGDKTSD
jgi:hypothetical protein